MKEKFEQPVVEVIMFGNDSDIITTSGGTNCGCDHGGDTEINKPHNPWWPWWPWWHW